MLLDLGKGSSRCPRLVNMYYKGAVRWRSAASARGHWMAKARSLREFQTSFADETSCAAFLFERRWPQGFVCPACGDGRAALLRSRAHTYECLDCGRQTSVTAGTVMPDLDSRTEFRHREWQKCWRLIKPGQKCGA